MPVSKKLPKGSTQSLVIGSPQNFKRGSTATNLLLDLGVPTLRGGDDGYGGALSRPDSPYEDNNSLISMKDILKESRLPLSTDSLAPLPKASLHHPLRLNPPESINPIDPAHLPTHAVELDGTPVRKRANFELHNQKDACDEESNPPPSRHSVVYGSFELGTPFFPIVEQAEEIQQPYSESSSSMGQTPANAEQQCHDQAKGAVYGPRSSSLHAVGPLPLEMREPLKIWQKYMKTGSIEVEVCPEALDSGGRYTWMHCWGLFNVYTFGASFINDTEFADRTMDMICEKIKLGYAADIDTITLVFTGKNISSRLKRLVVDRCVDAGEKDLRRSITRDLPQEFSIYALEAAMKRLAYSDDGQASRSPCRYHRHRYPDDCYLRKFANERDRRVVRNRKARNSRISTQACVDPDTIKSRNPALENTHIGESAVIAAGSKEKNSPPELAHESRGDVACVPRDTDGKSILIVQESELDTSESSVIAALGLNNEGASTARACNIIKPTGRATLIGTACTNHLEMDRIAPEAARDRDRVLQSWSRVIQGSLSRDLLPGSYPESDLGH
ncbi:hypothetical protein GRF29_1g501935 [Pseudopithomyces chartarum]|uniref:Uncharacterized protein n=1 Tax=Pseudopithomyces chartarum TaxID=1892770 RepID=A0AAN6M6E8_9PLEO|nr:hypothetical protein GRF29_1g501935 [Pseudopithomyces chartarum]